MKQISNKQIASSIVHIPGSKSYSHRALIVAALSDGDCEISNCLRSDDIAYTIRTFKSFGIDINDNNEIIKVRGSSGDLQLFADDIYLENSGTSMRLLTAVAALGKGEYILTGSERMRERPIQDLLDGLSQIGADVKSLGNNGCPPVRIKGGTATGGKVSLNCETSSQYLSALLLISPYLREGTDITVTKGPVSKPYIDITIDIMNKFGINVEREGYQRFKIDGGGIYRAGNYIVEPDCSQAGYFWAAGAITGKGIKVAGTTINSCQGDVKLAGVFEEMGCIVDYETDGIKVTGNNLHGIDIDMSNMPDAVPTLAVVAAFAEGITNIRNVGFLKVKESDRLTSVATELKKMGIKVEQNTDGLAIHGGMPEGTQINTYNDHRIAMSFAIAGLKIPGIRIENESCVEKSFPNFWQVMEGLY